MQNSSRTHRFFSLKYLALLLTIAWLCFIFGNSMQDAVHSAARSGQILEIVESTLEKIGIETSVTDFWVRKAAHFIEYTLLGVGLMLSLRGFTPRIGRNLTTVLFLGLLIPMLDESIQILFEGRGPQLTDVWLDYSGVLTGLLVTWGVIGLIRLRKRRKTDVIHSKARLDC